MAAFFKTAQYATLAVGSLAAAFYTVSSLSYLSKDIDLDHIAEKFIENGRAVCGDEAVDMQSSGVKAYNLTQMTNFAIRFHDIYQKYEFPFSKAGTQNFAYRLSNPDFVSPRDAYINALRAMADNGQGICYGDTGPEYVRYDADQNVLYVNPEGDFRDQKVGMAWNLYDRTQKLQR